MNARPTLRAMALIFLSSVSMHAQSTNGFPRPGENIARGRSYRLEPKPDYRHCTDPDDSTQLTDGVYAKGYFWTQKETVGWNQGNGAQITVDLGRSEPLCGVSFHTAGGVAGVQWPSAIHVLVSDDGQVFRAAGELATLGAGHGMPPDSGYAVHRYWTDRLHARGRFVCFALATQAFGFVDELEIYRGAPAWLDEPQTGKSFASVRDYVKSTSVRLGVQRRLRSDVQAIRAILTGEADAPLRNRLAAAEAEIANLGATDFDATFRAVLPINELHRSILRVQADAWRASGQPDFAVWPAGLWDPVEAVRPALQHIPAAALDVALMQNEYRAAAFNIDSTEERTATLRIVGLPGGDNPPWITVQEVQWTDTAGGVPIAAALPEAKRNGDAFLIDIPAGLTRQVWFTVHPVDVAPGTYRGRVELRAGSVSTGIPFTARIARLRFPDQPALHVGGWDYTDAEHRYEINATNRAAVITHLREHYVDSPWATSAALPRGRHDAQGRMTSPPDTAHFDEWLRRWPQARQYCVFAAVDDRFGAHTAGTPAFSAAVADWAAFWAGHARRRNLKPEQLALLLVDEPHGADQDRTILAWAQALRAAKTGLRIWEDPTHDNPAKADPQMMAACDVLCPNRPMFLARPAYQDYFANHRPPQTELAFYSCSGPVRLLDPYAYHRLQAWTAWRYGATSSFFWAFGDAGGGSTWNEFAADRTAYVPYFLDATSVTPAKHMEAIRESVGDYEYLVMLRDRVAEAERRTATPAGLDRARQLLARAAATVCDAPGAGQLHWRDAKDRAIADRVRLEILDLLVQLSAAR